MLSTNYIHVRTWLIHGPLAIAMSPRTAGCEELRICCLVFIISHLSVQALFGASSAYHIAVFWPFLQVFPFLNLYSISIFYILYSNQEWSLQIPEFCCSSFHSFSDSRNKRHKLCRICSSSLSSECFSTG